jgi:hypothetical protein
LVKNKSNTNTTKILDYTDDGFINEKHKVDLLKPINIKNSAKNCIKICIKKVFGVQLKYNDEWCLTNNCNLDNNLENMIKELKLMKLELDYIEKFNIIQKSKYEDKKLTTSTKKFKLLDLFKIINGKSHTSKKFNEEGIYNIVSSSDKNNGIHRTKKFNI